MREWVFPLPGDRQIALRQFMKKVSAAVIENDGRVLIARRKPTDTLGEDSGSFLVERLRVKRLHRSVSKERSQRSSVLILRGMRFVGASMSMITVPSRSSRLRHRLKAFTSSSAHMIRLILLKKADYLSLISYPLIYPSQRRSWR